MTADPWAVFTLGALTGVVVCIASGVLALFLAAGMDMDDECACDAEAEDLLADQPVGAISAAEVELRFNQIVRRTERSWWA